jgi:hypothetical protein
MEIKKIKWNKPGQNIRELTAGGAISLAEWKRILKKCSS